MLLLFISGCCSVAVFGCLCSSWSLMLDLGYSFSLPPAVKARASLSCPAAAAFCCCCCCCCLLPLPFMVPIGVSLVKLSAAVSFLSVPLLLQLGAALLRDVPLDPCGASCSSKQRSSSSSSAPVSSSPRAERSNSSSSSSSKANAREVESPQHQRQELHATRTVWGWRELGSLWCRRCAATALEQQQQQQQREREARRRSSNCVSCCSATNRDSSRE